MKTKLQEDYVMKTELFLFSDKGELFSKANPMHDCSFTAKFDNNTLILTFDHLEEYDSTLIYGLEGFKKLTIKYHDTEFADLTLKYKKTEKDFYMRNSKGIGLCRRL